MAPTARPGQDPVRWAVRADVAFDGERRLDRGALVVVEAGVIVGVEPATAPVPSDVEVVHRPGHALLPGLVDCHTHLCGDASPIALDQLAGLDRDRVDAIITDALRTHLRAGVTAVRDLGDVGWRVLDRRDDPDLPHVVASGPPITVPDGHCATWGTAVTDRDGLLEAVRERADRGADVVKVMTSGGLMTPSTDVLAPQFDVDDLRAAVEEAHHLGLPVTGHAHARAAVEQCLAAGTDGIEHCSCFTAGGPGLTAELAERIAASGTAVCPTLGHDPDVEIPPPVLAALGRFAIDLEEMPRQAAVLHEAGVLLVSGTDSGINPGKPHGLLHQALVELHDAGVATPDVLASATGLAADACGLSGRTGRLRPGLSADFLLVEGDPLADLAVLERPREVVLRGRIVTPDQGDVDP